jgi:glycosyltransferase involved in cell wall biosynthesis
VSGQTTQYSIVLPCYNEAESIPLILKRFGQVLQDEQVKLVLVDNGSTDNTPEVLVAALTNCNFAESIRVPVNIGYGYGIVQGLKHCNSPFIGWTHADMQTDPYDIFRAIKMLEAHSCSEQVYVKGQRRGRPLSDSFFTGGMGLIESLYMGTKLWDINAQPNLFHRSFFESWTNVPQDFALDLYAYFMARQKHLQIVRLDVQFPKRIHGQSKWNTGFKAKYKFILRTLEFSIKLKKSLKQEV